MRSLSHEMFNGIDWLDLRRCGEYITDSNIMDSEHNFIRITTIRYNGSVYYLEMWNGEPKILEKIA